MKATSITIMILSSVQTTRCFLVGRKAGYWGHVRCMQNNNDDNDTSFDVRVLEERLLQARTAVLEEEMRLPPNPNLKPRQFVQTLLRALWNNSSPLPDSGFRVLLRSSTPNWREALHHSVGAPSIASEEVVASALGDAMSRPDNQFGILVDGNDDGSVDGDDDDAPPYAIDFPTDVLDYADGSCWLECRLRGKDNGKLYVVMGWQLQQRTMDGAWLVDKIDWQDFRDDFRPGIGREEWMRICG